MELLIKLMVIILIVYTIFFYIRVQFFLNRYNKNFNTKILKESKKKLIIAIPVLREQRCIEDTVKHFSSIVNDIPIILITTQKEIEQSKENEETTQDIIKEKVISKHKNIYWVNYPYTTGYMAHQLNYMLDNIENILNEKIDLRNTFVAVYNADSKPNKNTFKEIKHKIENYNVIQQYSYCMKNYENLKNITKGFSIYQTNFELKTGLINSFF